ncbi:MAG TPA: hypothetical protein VFC53_10690, partial [Dehalococcoidia bacterium]|nr:hypothetical protein [Dehalococcoidia bacterium]
MKGTSYCLRLAAILAGGVLGAAAAIGGITAASADGPSPTDAVTSMTSAPSAAGQPLAWDACPAGATAGPALAAALSGTGDAQASCKRGADNPDGSSSGPAISTAFAPDGKASAGAESGDTGDAKAVSNSGDTGDANATSVGNARSGDTGDSNAQAVGVAGDTGDATADPESASQATSGTDGCGCGKSSGGDAASSSEAEGKATSGDSTASPQATSGDTGDSGDATSNPTA